MMGRGKKAAAGALRCVNLDFGGTGRDMVNKNCERFLAVRYCSEKCQREHWRRSGGNHKAHCKLPPKPDVAAASGPASAASPRGPPQPAATASGDHDADDPEHPCPICLANEDDHGECGQCFECGQWPGCCGLVGLRRRPAVRPVVAAAR